MVALRTIAAKRKKHCLAYSAVYSVTTCNLGSFECKQRAYVRVKKILVAYASMLCPPGYWCLSFRGLGF